jgi:hypothetical protein
VRSAGAVVLPRLGDEAPSTGTQSRTDHLRPAHDISCWTTNGLPWDGAVDDRDNDHGDGALPGSIEASDRDALSGDTTGWAAKSAGIPCRCRPRNGHRPDPAHRAWWPVRGCQTRCWFEITCLGYPASSVPSSRGLGHHPLKVATRVRIPLGLPTNLALRISAGSPWSPRSPRIRRRRFKLEV